MTETTGGVTGPDSRCPWCSSAVPAAAERCPSCGAALREGPSASADHIPGVTQVDPVLARRRQPPRPNRLVGWLADVDVEPLPAIEPTPRSAGEASTDQVLEGAGAASIAPPSDEVRREMRRLELEALKAEIEERAAEARLAALDAGHEVPPALSPDRPPAPGAEDSAGA